MSKITNIEGFLAVKLKQIEAKYSSESVILFRNFYEDISNKQLKELFSVLHKELNELFSFLNDKNSPGFGGHFNADPSRELLWIIEQLRIIQETLKDEYSFEIDDYYTEVLSSCKEFLSKSNGSPIPENFSKINIIESKPIFKLINIATIQGPNGQSFGNLKFKGEGSYAKVFKYRDPYYGFYIAVKRADKNLRPDELERFENEYKDLKTLDSPFIIKAYSYNISTNEYSMEYADETLGKYIEKNNSKMPFYLRRILVIQLLNAFEYIHSKKFLHRDISYNNILIKFYDDNSILIKLADFGLVKRHDSSLTRIGTEIKGSLNDYSDLNLIGFENYEIRHETYALAKVIYYILCGRQKNYHIEKNQELKSFILKAISSNKEDRFASINEMRIELTKTVIPSLLSKDKA